MLAAETFLADIAQNVAGDRLRVESFIPRGIDPHAFEATPRDATRLADSQVFIINGGGFEEWLGRLLTEGSQPRILLEASAGCPQRTVQSGELGDTGQALAGSVDPHFWLDPNQVIIYVNNIRAGLTAFDPPGAVIYEQNAQAYIARLMELDAWIATQVAQISLERRLLVTNHESLGYFADRYGFTIVGAIIPSFSTGASPSARQFASLIQRIRETQAPAVFLETGVNTELADQIAQETGVKVVTDLYTHTLTAPDGPAPTYLDMMKYNVQAIVIALK